MQTLDNEKLHAAQMFNLVDFEFAEEYQKLALNLELLTLYAREAAAEESLIDRRLYISEATDTMGISVSREANGDIVVTLPFLLAKRSTVKSDKYILDPLNNALSPFLGEENRIESGSFTVISYYSPENKAVIRDNDNTELRHVLNLLSSYFLVDDNDMDLVIAHRLADRTYTQITISARRSLPESSSPPATEEKHGFGEFLKHLFKKSA